MSEKTMTAVCLRGAGLAAITIEDRPIPSPGPGEVRVRVRASSLNYHDLAVVMGFIPSEDGRILMSDGAGEVDAIGDGVSRWSKGDRVMSVFFPNWPDGAVDLPNLLGVPGDHADGFAADYVCVPETALTAMPSHMSFQQAAALPCAGLTAWRSLFVEAKIKPGDWVLTQGSGGVSVFALQLAKSAGARVIATSSSKEKLDRLTALGADAVINYKEMPDWGAAAKALTGGRGVDTVVEIGGPGTLEQSIRACRVGGHIGMIGVLTGVAGHVPTALFFQSNLTMSGITVGSHAHQRDMVAAMEASNLEPVIDREFALANLADAFAYQAAQKHFGKIVITI